MKPTLNDLAVDLFGEDSHMGDAGERVLPDRPKYEPTDEDYQAHRDMWKRLSGRKKGHKNDN